MNIYLNICFGIRCEDWLTLDLFFKKAIKDRIKKVISLTSNCFTYHFVFIAALNEK